MIGRLLRQLAGGLGGGSAHRTTRGRGGHRRGVASGGIGASIGAAAERFLRGRRR